MRIGATISLDYWWSTRGLDDASPEYEHAMSGCHQRAADSILVGCLKNGGLYVKLGQGLVSMNHILPKEYLSTLKVGRQAWTLVRGCDVFFIAVPSSRRRSSPMIC